VNEAGTWFQGGNKLVCTKSDIIVGDKTLKEIQHEIEKDEILRLLNEIRAKGGLSAKRVDLLLKQLDSSKP
jgi:hypothetical protein